MQVHNGEHPRLGAVDVCPFIPLAGVTMEDCTSYAIEVAKFVGENSEFHHFFTDIVLKTRQEIYCQL